MLQDILEEFINYLTVVRNYSPRTLPGYKSQLERFFRTMDITSPYQISPQTVEKYLRSRLEAGISQNTNATTINALRAFLVFCNKRGYGRFDMTQYETPKRIPTMTQFLTEEEVNRMLEVMTRYRDKLMLLVMFTSGCRVSELVQLSIENWHGNTFEPQVKGRRLHTYLMDIAVAEELRMYCQLSGIYSGQVFRTTTGRPIGAPAVNYMLKVAAKKANISHNVSAHQLRRGFGTAMSEHGADMREIQALLGHRSILTTQRYVMMSDRRKQEAHQRYAPKIYTPSYPQENTLKSPFWT